MKKNILKYLASAAMAVGLSAQAASLTGQIDLSGSVTLNNQLLGSATLASAFTAVTVGASPTGDFSTTAGSPVTFSPFGWSPATTPVNPLWTFVSGGLTYSFDLASLSIVQQDNSFLNLMGVGTLHKTGFTDTPGSWSFTIPNAGGGAHGDFTFTFADSNRATTPDGGTTAILMGAALSVMALLRRKLA